MSFEDVVNSRRITMEDAWNVEGQLRQFEDLTIKTTSLRKKSWTIYCEAVEWKTLGKVMKAIKPRLISEKKTPIDDVHDVQKTRGNRRVKVLQLTGGGRIRIIAKNACFDRKVPVDKDTEWSQRGNGQFIGDCAKFG